MVELSSKRSDTYLFVPELVSAWLEWGEQLADKRSRVVVGHSCVLWMELRRPATFSSEARVQRRGVTSTFSYLTIATNEQSSKLKSRTTPKRKNKIIIQARFFHSTFCPRSPVFPFFAHYNPTQKKMFTQQNRKNRQLLASGIKSTYDDDLYPTRLNFYREPPRLEISIEEFEQFALDRMQGTLFFTHRNAAPLSCYRPQASGRSNY